jgi:hypothetical protein
MQRGRLPYFLISLAALIAVVPFILDGCSCGHDFGFHLLNWLEAARQFRDGTFHVRWAFTPGYNAGEPRFVFYPPLSWTIGALLSLVLPFAWTPVVYTWLVLTSAGFALHRLVRSFVPPTAAILAAVFYLVNPYTLFTAYERTAYAELLAAVWIPLLLHAAFQPEDEGGVTVPRIALPVALLWLTNAPAAVMSCYALALLTVIRLVRPELRGADSKAYQSRASVALNTAAGTALGLGLAAFYLIPAAYERRYVQIKMAILEGLRVQDNYLFHHTADQTHDVVLHTASMIAVMILIATAVTLGFVWILRFAQDWKKGSTDLLPALAALTVTIGFLLTPVSNFVWVHAPELAYLQFPWRLLAILAAVLGLVAALALRSVQLKPAATAGLALIIAAAFTYPAYRTFRQGCDPEDPPAARAALFHSGLGSEATDEYTAVTADNDALKHSNPPYWLALDPTAAAPSGTQTGPAPVHLSLNSRVQQTLILNLRDYPAWRVALNGVVVSDREQRDDGLIAVPLAAGPARVDISYAQLPDQIVGDSVTVISLGGFVLLLVRKRRLSV